MEKENFFPMKTCYLPILSGIVENRIMYRRLGKKIIVSVKSSILRDFWATGMSRNLSMKCTKCIGYSSLTSGRGAGKREKVKEESLVEEIFHSRWQ